MMSRAHKRVIILSLDAMKVAMTGAMKGGIGYNRKVEKIRLDLRCHRYAVNQSLSDAAQGSGLMVIHTAKVICSYSGCD